MFVDTEMQFEDFGQTDSQAQEVSNRQEFNI